MTQDELLRNKFHGGTITPEELREKAFVEMYVLASEHIREIVYAMKTYSVVSGTQEELDRLYEYSSFCKEALQELDKKREFHSTRLSTLLKENDNG